MSRSLALVWCDRVMFGALLPIVFFLPISTAIVEIGSTICILAFVTKFILKRFSGNQEILRDQIMELPPKGSDDRFLKWPLLSYFLAVFLSVLMSHFPGVSWKGFIGKTLEAIFLYMIVIDTIQSRKRLTSILFVFSLSAIVVSIDGIWQHFTHTEFIFSKPIPGDLRITGPFGHPNDFAAYLVVCSLFFLGMIHWAWANFVGKSSDQMVNGLFSRTKRNLVFVFVGIILTIMALGWTFSRGAWIGFLGGAVILIILDRKHWVFPVFFILVFGVFFISEIGSVRNVSFISDDLFADSLKQNQRVDIPEQDTLKLSHFRLLVDDQLKILSRFSAMGRQVFWNETMIIVEKSPLFGTGINSFSDAAQRYIPHWTGYYSHNCYLQMLAETGILGLGSFLWLIFALVRKTVKTISKSPSGFLRSVLCALLSAVVGFLIHSSFDTNFYSSRLANMMWIFMGLIAAIASLKAGIPEK